MYNVNSSIVNSSIVNSISSDLDEPLPHADVSIPWSSNNEVRSSTFVGATRSIYGK